jgi:hypothetical protein
VPDRRQTPQLCRSLTSGLQTRLWAIPARLFFCGTIIAACHLFGLIELPPSLPGVVST